MFTKMHIELRAHISYIREESVEKEYAKGEQKASVHWSKSAEAMGE